jgi:hypothetical protein
MQSVLCDDMTGLYEKYFRTTEGSVTACQTEVKKKKKTSRI